MVITAYFFRKCKWSAILVKYIVRKIKQENRQYHPNLIKHCFNSGGAMFEIVVKLKFLIKKDVKDIYEWDIFDIFFCVIKFNHFIRGPPYQFKF